MTRRGQRVGQPRGPGAQAQRRGGVDGGGFTYTVSWPACPSSTRAQHTCAAACHLCQQVPIGIYAYMGLSSEHIMHRTSQAAMCKRQLATARHHPGNNNLNHQCRPYPKRLPRHCVVQGSAAQSTHQRLAQLPPAVTFTSLQTAVGFGESQPRACAGRTSHLQRCCRFRPGWGMSRKPHPPDHRPQQHRLTRIPTRTKHTNLQHRLKRATTRTK